MVDQFDLQQHKPQQIFFHISILDEVGVTLFIEERNKALKMRPLKSNMLSYLGPSLKTEGTQRHTRVMLSLSQDLDTEHNPDKGCRHYPYGHSVIFPRGVVHRVENGWGLTKVAVVLLNGLLW